MQKCSLLTPLKTKDSNLLITLNYLWVASKTDRRLSSKFISYFKSIGFKFKRLEDLVIQMENEKLEKAKKIKEDKVKNAEAAIDS